MDNFVINVKNDAGNSLIVTRLYLQSSQTYIVL